MSSLFIPVNFVAPVNTTPSTSVTSSAKIVPINATLVRMLKPCASIIDGIAMARGADRRHRDRRRPQKQRGQLNHASSPIDTANPPVRRPPHP